VWSALGVGGKSPAQMPIAAQKYARKFFCGKNGHLFLLGPTNGQNKFIAHQSNIFQP
jgi:hypothetical protein